MSLVGRVVRWGVAVAACAVIAAGCSALAQSASDGAIAGRVLWADGRADTFAHIELIPVDALVSSSIARTGTRRDGSFILLKVEPGAYQVRVTDARVIGLSASADVDVEPGIISQVTLHVSQVSAAPKNAAPTQAGLANQLTIPRIAELPFGESQWERTSQLFEQAGDASSAAASTNEEHDGSADSAEASRRGGAQGGFVSSTSGLSFAGLPSTQNAHSIDGLSATQNFRSGPRGAAAGGPVSGSSFGQSAVRSFRVLPRTYSAQYGNAAGAVLAVSSRAASQQMHGGAFYLLRTSAFDATNPFSVVSRYQNGIVSTSVVKPQDTLNQFGVHVSLPLFAVRGRTATKPTIFTSLEQQQRSNPAVSTPENGSFYALTATQTALLRNRGVNAAAQNRALTYLDSLSGPVDRSSSRTLLFLRADSNIARHDRVEFSYALNRFNSPAGTGFDQSSDAVVARTFECG